MESETQDLIKAERRRNDFRFTSEVIPKRRARPIKYRHNLSMPAHLYEELRDKGVINKLELEAYQDVYFEMKQDEIMISFVNLYAIEDLHRHIDCYLIKKITGNYPLKRGGFSKL